MRVKEKVILILICVKLFNSQLTDDPNFKSAFQNSLQQRNREKQTCKCLNNGECYSITSDSTLNQTKKQVLCICSSAYIGEKCQTQATHSDLSKQIVQKINIHDYKYFYYEPNQQNMFSFVISICLDPISVSVPSTQKSEVQTESITFFMTTQNQNGSYQVDEEKNHPTTLKIQETECKRIQVDYTFLLVTKLRSVQKLIFGIKLGSRIVPPVKKDTDDVDSSIFGFTNSSLFGQSKIFRNLYPISYTVKSQKRVQESVETHNKLQSNKLINQIGTKSPSKLKQNQDLYRSRVLNFKVVAEPFAVEYLFFNIFFSLTTIGAFLIVGIMIFVIRSRILGIRIAQSFTFSSRLINDLKHFDKYIPAQKYIKKERKQGDMSPNSSQTQCAICLIKFEQLDVIRRTPCSHSFHKGCIDPWCHQNLTCPMCRKNLTQKNMAEYYSSTALQLKNSPQSDQ